MRPCQVRVSRLYNTIVISANILRSAEPTPFRDAPFDSRAEELSSHITHIPSSISEHDASGELMEPGGSHSIGTGPRDIAFAWRDTLHGTVPQTRVSRASFSDARVACAVLCGRYHAVQRGASQISRRRVNRERTRD